MDCRSPDGDNLVCIIHPWESGLDASPVYDPAWGITDPQPPFLVCQLKLKLIFKDLYPKFLKLPISYKWKYDWDQKKICQSPSPSFLFKDVGVNSVYAAGMLTFPPKIHEEGWGILGRLAGEIEDSEIKDYCLEQQNKVETAILTKMWDAELARFISLYKDESVCLPFNRTSLIVGDRKKIRN